MMLKWLTALSIFALATACVQSTAAPLLAPDPFDPSFPPDSTEYLPFTLSGTGSIQGQAFLKTRGGDVKPAAGNAVLLDPLTRYSREFWRLRLRGPLFLWDVSAVHSLFDRVRRSTIADAQGKFHFDELPAGDYFVHTTVTWEVATAGMQGGVVGDSVIVKNGRSTEMIIAK